jgi:acetylxylan esterase
MTALSSSFTRPRHLLPSPSPSPNTIHIHHNLRPDTNHQPPTLKMWPSPKTAFLLLAARAALATPVELEERQTSCPGVHVFGARETTVGPGYGSSSTVVNAVLNAYPGSTAEAISYPACGGQSSCGGVSYANSANQGTAAVASAVNAFYSRCPSTQLVLVGYSQGGQIMDNALCGGGDSGAGITSTAVPISAGAVGQIKAAIFMGDPRFVKGLPYEVGTCQTQGVSSPPSTFFLDTNSHTDNLPVRRPPSRFLLPQRQQDPVLLRLGGSILLHGQRRQRPPGLRRRVRPAGARLYQEQDQQQLRWRRWDAYYHGWQPRPDFAAGDWWWWELCCQVGTVRWAGVDGCDLLPVGFDLQG